MHPNVTLLGLIIASLVAVPYLASFFLPVTERYSMGFIDSLSHVGATPARVAGSYGGWEVFRSLLFALSPTLGWFTLLATFLAGAWVWFANILFLMGLVALAGNLWVAAAPLGAAAVALGALAPRLLRARRQEASVLAGYFWWWGAMWTLLPAALIEALVP